jgi:DNA modification methylase
MKYEGSIGFVSRKWKKIIADFQVLGLFMTKNIIWAKENFRLSRVVAVERKIC